MSSKSEKLKNSEQKIENSNIQKLEKFIKQKEQQNLVLKKLLVNLKPDQENIEEDSLSKPPRLRK